MLMMSISEERVRERAYFIWEREGRPHGKELEHWNAALRELEAETAKAADPPLENGSADAARAKPSRKGRIRAMVARARDALEAGSAPDPAPKKRRRTPKTTDA